ncbi:MAG: hypothetical protein ABI837_02320 [Acidobacteriota bacterium]
MKKRALVFLIPLLTACATAHHGPMQRLAIDSDPAGAVISLQHCGAFAIEGAITPAVVMVSRRVTQCTVAVSKSGYKPISVRLDRHVSPQFAANSAALTVMCGDVFECNHVSDLAVAGIVGGALAGAGMATDAVTGAMFELRPALVHAILCTDQEPCSGGVVRQGPEQRE